jgi:hypothetical protein
MNDEDSLTETEGPKHIYDPDDHTSTFTVNKIRKVKVYASLVDKEENKVSLKDFVGDINSFIFDSMKDESGTNQIVEYILPLLGQCTPSTMEHLFGPTGFTDVLVRSPDMRFLSQYSMAAGYLILKAIQKHGYKITIEEEAMSQDELEILDLKSKVQSFMNAAIMTGFTLEEVILRAISSSKITPELFTEELCAELGINHETLSEGLKAQQKSKNN